MPWLTIFLARLASGEQFRKVTPTERRWYGAYFLFIPIALYSFVHFGHKFLDRAGAAAIWIFMTAGFTGVYMGVAFWARHVSACVSLVLGIIVWTITFWLAFTDRLF